MPLPPSDIYDDLGVPKPSKPPATSSSGSSGGSSPSKPGRRPENADMPVFSGWQDRPQFSDAAATYGGSDAAGVSWQAMPQVTSLENARDWLKEIRATDRETYNDVVEAMRAAGFLGPRASAVSSVEDAWNTVVDAAARAYRAGQMVSPQDIIMSAIQAGGTGSSGVGGGGGGGGVPAYDGPVTTTQTQTQAAKPTKEQSRATLEGAMADLLGRAPTKKEVAEFHRKLTHAFEQNPTVTQTTQTATPGDGAADGGNIDTSSVSSGGVESSVRAEDYAKSRPDYAEYQMATKFFDTFQNMIRGG